MPTPDMDWFHCNICFLLQNETYYITSCGHIICQKCAIRDKCSVCRKSCKYLALSENVSNFQKQQHELQIAFFKQHISKAQNALQEAIQKINSQESELKAMKRDNAELRSMVIILKGSMNKSQNNRMCTSRPVITPPSQPVTPQYVSQPFSHVVSHSSSESMPFGISRSGGQSQLASASSVQEMTTPLSSSHGTPMSGHSLSSRIPSQSSSMVTLPLLGELSRDHNQANIGSTTPHQHSAGSLTESSTPSGSSNDRLRAIRVN
ncbi:hypothetical protein GDO86_001554 [Hymenochirus boettgeri]|uniref:RING-type domain-containing protein n=1 Tax=Hymenochirus boettgeri TaxID=247094 RepID=A0A8T2KHK1_9PIPI|nr:hypothetical protein GDO86_001554 [Hymenochirus boettgeri]KAG8455405.1 hypothetical protein GDO86_001554 [Hymenochirus boettgeri]